MAKSCSNCGNRYESSCVGTVMCPGWERCDTEEDGIACASSCERYLEDDRTHEEFQEEYTPSATYGDYSPSCPWNAPGMSISDFI